MSVLATAKKIEEQPERVQEFAWNKKILVVDDEVEIANLYKEVLQTQFENVVSIRSSRSASPEGGAPSSEFCFDVTVVNSAREALQELEKAESLGSPFAMGFFDVMLNDEIDGFELAKKAYDVNPDMYVVFVTAYNDRSIDSINDFLGPENVNRWDYINKPINSNEITQKARNFVSLWNLQKEKTLRSGQIAELNRRILTSERMTTVAAVSRGVAHEFGNILMQIMGKAEIGRNKPEPQMKDAMEKILQASQRASEILDRFKNLSSHSHEKPPKKMGHLHLVLDEALDLMGHQLKTNNVKACKIKIDKVPVLFNDTCFLQIFVNLIINSIHAMKSSGQIDFSILDIGEDVEIKIRDYGPGISEELIHKVCDAFFTTKGDSGTGLGLAIVKEMVEIDHRGKFSIKNSSVKGLEISIRIPKQGSGEEKNEA